MTSVRNKAVVAIYSVYDYNLIVFIYMLQYWLLEINMHVTSVTCLYTIHSNYIGRL